MPIIEVKNLSYAYDEGSEVLHNLNLQIARGSITAVIGLSGCGKTTFCRSLCGIIPNVLGGSLNGQILLDTEDINKYLLAKLATKIALVMQNPDHQLVTTTVEDELAFAPENLCLPPHEINRRVDKALELLNLQKFRLRNPTHLSGGEKQLVAIASVLTLEPQVLVLDEAMSHLDEDGKAMVKDALIALNENGKTIIIVEHDLQTATFADSWVVMGEGKIIREDSPAAILADQSFLHEQNLY
jgi:energy-coupling factor transport system ATP-binding protein